MDCSQKSPRTRVTRLLRVALKELTSKQEETINKYR